jgi:hypothetical protein
MRAWQIQRQATNAIGPAEGKHAKAPDKTAGGVIPNPAEQLDLFGSGPIVSAVINDQNGFSLVAGKPI